MSQPKPNKAGGYQKPGKSQTVPRLQSNHLPPSHPPHQRDEERKEPAVQVQVAPPQPAAPPEDMYQIPKEDVKCIICMDIYEVLLADRACGAMLCEMCATRVRVCPNCRGPAQFERNAVLDHFMSSVLIQCKCGEKLKKRDIAAHKQNCPYERITCPAETCQDVPAMERPEFIKHLKDIHMEQFMQAFTRKYPSSYP